MHLHRSRICEVTQSPPTTTFGLIPGKPPWDFVTGPVQAMQRHVHASLLVSIHPPPSPCPSKSTSSKSRRQSPSTPSTPTSTMSPPSSYVLLSRFPALPFPHLPLQAFPPTATSQVVSELTPDHRLHPRDPRHHSRPERLPPPPRPAAPASGQVHARRAPDPVGRSRRRQRLRHLQALDAPAPRLSHAGPLPRAGVCGGLPLVRALVAARGEGEV